MALTVAGHIVMELVITVLTPVDVHGKGTKHVPQGVGIDGPFNRRRNSGGDGGEPMGLCPETCSWT